MTEYIKREDVHLALDSHYFPGELSLRETIDSIPSADVVERKKGKWIAIDELNVHNSDGYYIGDQIECQCSICGKNVWLFETEKDYNFCPYCDADMRRTK